MIRHNPQSRLGGGTEIERYTLMFDHLRASALSTAVSASLVARVAAEMT
jgi:hypothetical protein